MLQYAKSWLVKDAQNPHRIRFKKNDLRLADSDHLSQPSSVASEISAAK